MKYKVQYDKCFKTLILTSKLLHTHVTFFSSCKHPCTCITMVTMLLKTGP